MTYTYTTTYVKGMNTRPDHNVNNAPNGAVAYGQVVSGIAVWEAPADGVNVRKGDKWMQLESGSWVAVVHMGVTYGVVTEKDTDPIFPESFTLTDPSGKKAEYVFVRVVE